MSVPGLSAKISRFFPRHQCWQGSGWEKFLVARTRLRRQALPLTTPTCEDILMVQTSTKPADFGRAMGEAKREAAGVANAVGDAAQDVYGQARDSAGDVADSARKAARKTAGSFEQAIRHTVETQPYAAAAIALGIGWLLGRMHRPL
jgi:ElaB/YqjD/DUF883 family membrane-anchored ribosome-binding protein